MAGKQNSDVDTGKLREATDRGELGDKIGQHDPAAAPENTGAEAAGTPTPAREAEKALQDQKRTGGQAQQKREHFGNRTQPQRESAMHGGVIWGAILAALAIAGLALGFGMA